MSRSAELLDVIVLTRECRSDSEWVIVDQIFHSPGFDVYFVVQRKFEMKSVIMVRAYQILEKVGRLDLEEGLIHDSEKIRKVALSLSEGI